MKANIVATLVLTFSLCQCIEASSATPGYRADYQRISSSSVIQDKNFYVLTLLQECIDVRADLAADRALAAIGDRLIAQSYPDFDSAVRAMMFSDAEIANARARLTAHIPKSTALRALVTEHLRPSGTYQRLSVKSDAEMLSAAWTEAARGVNRVIGHFALGVDIRYPDIDSPSYEVKAPGYQRMVLGARDGVVRSMRESSNVLFFEPSLDFALGLMEINRRNEAGRHEPLAQGENRAAVKKMLRTDWSDYPYASLLVHGIGHEESGVAISKESRENCAVSAALYAQRMAPFVIVSGGYVHPKQTIFSEAIEMKRELMLVHGVPESAILVEPQARHTTTNVRNAARILFAARIPPDKPSLSVSSKAHIDSIVSEQFTKRCEIELGYSPARYGERISDFAVEFVPSLDALHIDPRDPLDP